MGGTSGNDNGGELKSESLPSPLDAKPLNQFAGLTHSTLETSTTQQQTMVGEVGSSQLRTHKTRSIVWTHFVKLVINGEQKAKCMHCHRLFSGDSKNGTSNLIAHMSRRCPRRFGRVVPRQKLLTFNRSRQEATTMKVVEDNSSLACLGDGEDEHLLSVDIGLESGVVEKSMSPDTSKIFQERVTRKSMSPDTRKIVQESLIESHSDGNEHAPICVDGGSQCSEPECGSLRNLVIKANYKDDTVRFDLPLTSSVDQLEKEVAKNLKLALNSFKMKYQDEDKEWMLMTMDSHLSYVIKLAQSSGSNVVRLLVSDL